MQFSSKEDTIQLTPQWTGERFDDGRPRVPDDILRRVAENTITELWKPLYVRGYKFQFEGSLKRSNPDKNVLVGRVVTANFMPTRPDLHSYLMKYGHEQEGRVGNFNQWPIDQLIKDDVMIYDMYGKVYEGCPWGGNLTNVIANRTGGTGGIIYGGVRDLEQIIDIKSSQFYYLDTDPTPFMESMLVGINTPCRIGKAVCMPGDVVLGTISGVLFIPPHLAEICVIDAEKSHVRDIWGFTRVREAKYSGAEVDSPWTVPMWDDFAAWFSSDQEALPYQHLNFAQELEDSKHGIVRNDLELLDTEDQALTRW